MLFLIREISLTNLNDRIAVVGVPIGVDSPGKIVSLWPIFERDYVKWKEEKFPITELQFVNYETAHSLLSPLPLRRDYPNPALLRINHFFLNVFGRPDEYERTMIVPLLCLERRGALQDFDYHTVRDGGDRIIRVVGTTLAKDLVSITNDQNLRILGEAQRCLRLFEESFQSALKEISMIQF